MLVQCKHWRTWTLRERVVREPARDREVAQHEGVRLDRLDLQGRDARVAVRDDRALPLGHFAFELRRRLAQSRVRLGPFTLALRAAVSLGEVRVVPVGGFRERWDGVSWDVAQATFSLQSLTPEERRETLGWLRKAAKRVVLAEFDVPAFDQQLGPTRVKHIAKRYERGLAEYDGDGGQVAQGFLMPVFFGYFDPTVSRTNYEQPMATWLQELREAGFAEVRQTPVYDYWWAPACLLDAR